MEKRQPNFQRPKLTDYRLILGVGLLIASVLLMLWLIDMSKATSAYLIADKDMSIGEKLTPQDLREVEANLADAGQLYLHPGDFDTGATFIVVRPIRAGEYVPLAGIQDEVDFELYPVTIDIPNAEAKQLVVGANADIWTVAKSEDAPAQILVSDVQIHEILTTGGRNAQLTPVVVLADRGAVSEILTSQHHGDGLNILPQLDLQSTQGATP